MLEKEIPFEIHITTHRLSSSNELDFVAFCLTAEAKPLMIELSKGDVSHQPMLSKIVYATHVEDVLSIATSISNSMNSLNFPVKRLKIEVPSMYSGELETYTSNFEKYFECHIKINIDPMDKLLELCEKHKVHLSLNSLRNEINIRFITLREFGTKLEFEQRVLALINDFQQANFKILKQQSEYCVYDNNSFLDNGWLPQ